MSSNAALIVISIIVVAIIIVVVLNYTKYHWWSKPQQQYYYVCNGDGTCTSSTTSSNGMTKCNGLGNCCVPNTCPQPKKLTNTQLTSDNASTILTNGTTISIMANESETTPTAIACGSYLNVDNTTGALTWGTTPQFFTITVGASTTGIGLNATGAYPITLSTGNFLVNQLGVPPATLQQLSTVANSGQQPGDLATVSDHNSWTAVLFPLANGVTRIATESIYWFSDATEANLEGGWLSSEAGGWQERGFTVTTSS